jgi:hypothetical protein
MQRYCVAVSLASVVLSIGLSSGQAATSKLAAWWKFENIENDAVTESIRKTGSKLYGFQKQVDGVSGKGLLLDGYTTYVEADRDIDLKLSAGFSVEAWIAFQAYPWNWVAIVDKQEEETAGYNLSVDANGFLRFQVVVDGKLQTVKSNTKMRLLKWYQLVGVFAPDTGLTIYIDGEKVGSTAVQGNLSGEVTKSLPRLIRFGSIYRHLILLTALLMRSR